MRTALPRPVAVQAILRPCLWRMRLHFGREHPGPVSPPPMPASRVGNPSRVVTFRLLPWIKRIRTHRFKSPAPFLSGAAPHARVRAEYVCNVGLVSRVGVLAEIEGAKMAYRAQKVQKVMVQPIVSLQGPIFQCYSENTLQFLIRAHLATSML